jgi:hypothetical protein
MKPLVLVTKYDNGICKGIQKRYPKTFDSAKALVEKIKAETVLKKGESLKVEIVNRF